MQPEVTVPIDEAAEPTFATLPGVASVNGVYSDHTCCEEDGQHHRKHKGDSLEGAEGWALGEEEAAEWWQADEETGEQL